MWVGTSIAVILALFSAAVISPLFGPDSPAQELLGVAFLVIFGALLGGAIGWLWGGLFEWIAPPRDTGVAASGDDEGMDRP
jgi:hypothetical protein